MRGVHAKTILRLGLVINIKKGKWMKRAILLVVILILGVGCSGEGLSVSRDSQNQNNPVVPPIDTPQPPLPSYAQWESGDALVEYFGGEITITKIRGNGMMADYEAPHTRGCADICVPWSSYRDSITTITIDSGVTYVASNAFNRFQRVTRITLTHTLDSIGMLAFWGTPARTIDFPYIRPYAQYRIPRLVPFVENYGRDTFDFMQSVYDSCTLRVTRGYKGGPREGGFAYITSRWRHFVNMMEMDTACTADTRPNCWE